MKNRIGYGTLASGLVKALTVGTIFMASSFGNTAKADVRFSIDVNYDVTGAGGFGQYLDDFNAAFSTVEGLLHSWSGPRAIESQYNGFTMDVTFDAIDGAFGILAFAGPNDVLRWGGPGYTKNGSRGAVAVTGGMTVDTDDIGFMVATGIFQDTIIHETMHALGFGTLWNDFGYVDRSGLGFTGQNAVTAYREGSGNTFAPFVPLEASGGAGTQGGHWEDDDPYFYDPTTGLEEIMIGTAYGNQNFISEVTLAQFRDLGYNVPDLSGGRTDDIWPDGGSTKPSNPGGDDDDGTRTGDDWGSGDDGSDDPSRPGRPGGRPGKGDDGWVYWGSGSGRPQGFSAVPEPTSFAILAAAGVAGLISRRRRA